MSRTGNLQEDEGVTVDGGPPLQEVLDGIEDPVFVKDRVGRYVYMNRACAAALGVDEVRRGFTDHDVLRAEDASALRAVDEAVMSTRAMRTIEERVSTEGGQRIFLSTKLPWFTRSNEVIGVIGIARDVTDQRTAEAALRESESRFRLLADAAPVLMWTMDATGDCDFVNREYVKFTGRPAGDHLGDGWLRSVHAQDRARVESSVKTAFGDRVPYDIEFHLRHREGTFRWVRTSSAPRLDDDGSFTGYVGSGIDVHDARLQQIAVTQSAEELQRLTSELEATVVELRQRTSEAERARAVAERTEREAVFLDEVSRVLQATLDAKETLRSIANLAVPRLADHCIVHLASEDAFTRIDAHPDPNDPVAQEIAERYPTWAGIGPTRVARTGVSELFTEVTPATLERAAQDAEHLDLLRRQGLTSAMVVPMRAGPRILGTIMLATSTAGRRFEPEDLRLAEELGRRAALAIDNAQLYRTSQKASRAKSEFLAAMSHELRTPLNAISGYADLLQLGVSGEEQRGMHLTRIKESARSLVKMIEEILTFSRLEAGSETTYVETVDARVLIREAADLLSEAASRKGLELRVDAPEDPVPLTTDRLKVRQVLMNLLSNAVKFTNQGSVTVHLKQSSHEVCFSVADTGRGMRPDETSRVYEPFWQAESGMTRQTGGTGIGMTVARGLADLLGGVIEIESTYGVGSVFTLKLPRSRNALAGSV